MSSRHPSGNPRIKLPPKGGLDLSRIRSDTTGMNAPKYQIGSPSSRGRSPEVRHGCVEPGAHADPEDDHRHRRRLHTLLDSLLHYHTMVSLSCACTYRVTLE